MRRGYQSFRASKIQTLFYAGGVTNAYGWEVRMGNEQKRSQPPEREPPLRQPEEEKPQTWKHPDDGTELSERDQERPLKP